MKKLLAFLLVSIMVFSLVGCSTPQEEVSESSQGVESQEVEAYTIALIAPLTGDNAQYGEAFVTALEVLCKEVNDAGGINGIPLEYEVFDDAADPAQSASIAQKVTSDEKYIACVGSYTSTSALAFAPIFDEAQMPVLVPNSGNSQISADYNYTFQRGMIIPIESEVVTRCAVEDLGGEKIAFIALNNDAGLETLDSAQATIAELQSEGVDCEIVAIESFNEGEVDDYSAIVLNLLEADPDTIVVNLGYTECAAILNQAQQVGLTDVQWVGNGSMYTEDFTNLVGDAGNGFYVSSGFVVDNPDAGVQEFVEACTAVSGREPNQYERNSYECAAMIAYCLQEGATTRAELYDALLAIEVWEGKTGTNAWENRRAIEEYFIIPHLSDGNWEILE